MQERFGEALLAYRAVVAGARRGAVRRVGRCATGRVGLAWGLSRLGRGVRGRVGRCVRCLARGREHDAGVAAVLLEAPVVHVAPAARSAGSVAVVDGAGDGGHDARLSSSLSTSRQSLQVSASGRYSRRIPAAVARVGSEGARSLHADAGSADGAQKSSRQVEQAHVLPLAMSAAASRLRTACSKVARLELDTQADPAHRHRAVDLAADPHEGREHFLAGRGAQVEVSSDHVELQRVDVLLVVLVLGVRKGSTLSRRMSSHTEEA